MKRHRLNEDLAIADDECVGAERYAVRLPGDVCDLTVDVNGSDFNIRHRRGKSEDLSEAERPRVTPLRLVMTNESSV